MAVALTYLAWSYDKLKWQYVLPIAVSIVIAALFFGAARRILRRGMLNAQSWGVPSAQHRASAWRRRAWKSCGIIPWVSAGIEQRKYIVKIIHRRKMALLRSSGYPLNQHH